MDDSTQDRASHTPGNAAQERLLSHARSEVKDMQAKVNEWAIAEDDYGKAIREEFRLCLSQHQEDLAELERVFRMADSHADLLAALEAALDSLVYIEENIPKLIGSGVRHRAINTARDALAKATGQRAIPDHMTRDEGETP